MWFSRPCGVAAMCGCQRCHRRSQRWIEEGVLDELLRTLAEDLKEQGRLDLFGAPSMKVIPWAAPPTTGRGDNGDGPGPRVYERADIGNGERFADEHGRNVRWISKWGKHLVWTGRVWQTDHREEVSRKAQATAKATAKATHADALEPGVDLDEQRKISRHAITSQSAPEPGR